MRKETEIYRNRLPRETTMSQEQLDPFPPIWMTQLYNRFKLYSHRGKPIIISINTRDDKEQFFIRMAATGSSLYSITTTFDLEGMSKMNTILIDAKNYDSGYFRNTDILKSFSDWKIVVFTRVVVDVCPEAYNVYDITSGSLVEVTSDNDHPINKNRRKHKHLSTY